ncbi:MAG: menaquinone biosynthesis decarboxylase [Planctomycetaceae bacterium]|nr:menaquinone biosynthesis decarboxylase [Planctomycetaceae bacterium]
MPYANLRQFIEALDAAGELHRVTAPVSPILEVTEITDRISKSPAPNLSPHARRNDPHHHQLGGKALLFENVDGASMPLAINTFGSYRRVEMALGGIDVGFDGLGEQIGAIVKPEPPIGLIEKMKKGLELVRLASYAPKITGSGICQQVVRTGDEIDLFELPVIKCWPLDGDPAAFGFPDVSPNTGEGRYITLGGMYTIHPDDAGKPEGQPRTSRNIGMYRAQLLSRNTTAMHWHVHHDGARHWRAWKETGQPMPLAIAFGGESVLPYAATAPMPPGVSELLFAGFLNQSAIPLVRCKTIDLHVPANAELVIEGHVSTEAGGPGMSIPDCESAPGDAFGDHAALEGPFGDHTGFYSLPDRYPVFTVTAITHRTDPIYPATIVGLPPQEDYYLGKATERIFLPLLQTIVPDIIDYDLPMFGAFHNCAFVQIKKAYPFHARRIMHAIWGAGQMSWTKFIVVVDHDVDVHDHEQVMFHVGANCDPGRDLEIVTGPLDILDHAAPQMGAGHKMGIDATTKLPTETANGHAVRPFPARLSMSEAIRQQVESRWAELGLD